VATSDLNRRSTLLIKREFQLGFIVRLVGLVLLGGVLGGILLYLGVGMELEALSYQVHRRPPEAESSILTLIVLVNGLAILLVSGAAAWITLYTLHRVAGPLTRLERIVRSIGEGHLDVSPALRHNDELQKFPAALSEMVQALAERVGRLRNAHQAMRRDLDGLPPDAEASEPLLALRKGLDEAEAVLAEFKTQ
jgi:HAMP domain-containing protein